MGQVQSVALSALAFLACALAIVYFTRALRFWKLVDVCGPSNSHRFFGHIPEIASVSPVLDEWVAKYGRVVKYASIMNMPELLVTDLRAIQHILQDSNTYHKPSTTRAALTHLVGRGVLVTEGDQHRMQRKALNPAFGPGQLRDLTGIFLDKANELCDVVDSHIGSFESAQMEVMTHLSNCTLDIIGLAGFGYSFNAMSLTAGEPNELSAAFTAMMHAAQSSVLFAALEWPLPILRLLPTKRNNAIRTSMSTMRRIGTHLLQERKADAALEAAQGEKIADSRARDLLSLLVRANTAADPRQRLSDEEVLAQIPTFLVAGHETTSTLLTWIIYELALHPDVQVALRAECRGSPLPIHSEGNAPLVAHELTALDKLPLLDAVVRETLRLDAPVTNTDRVPIHDVVLPLAEPVRDARGELRDSIFVNKGTVLEIPIALVNRLEFLWGPDAKQWNPRRWTDGPLPEAVKDVPGVFGSMLSFLGGPHGCIGFRFSLYETKIIMHALVSKFDFALAVPAEKVGRMEGIVTRPFLLSQKELGPQLPVIVKRSSRELPI